MERTTVGVERTTVYIRAAADPTYPLAGKGSFLVVLNQQCSRDLAVGL